MLVSVLPLFLAGTLQAPAGVIGLIEGLAEAMASVMKAVSGWLSDRSGRRKPLMVAGYGLSNILKPLLGFAGSWGQVLAIRLSDRFGKGLRAAPRDALIAESAAPEVRGKAFGLHRAMDTVGAAIGPMAAWLILLAWPGQYRKVFLWAALPGMLAVALLLLFLREPRGEVAETKAGPVFRNWSLSVGALSPELRRYLAVGLVFSLGNSSDAFLVLRAQNLGLSAPLVPLAYFCLNLSSSVLAYPAGALSDRFGRKPLLVTGLGAFAAIYLGFGLATKGWVSWPLFLAYGLYYAFTEGVQKAYIADLADPEQRATAIGVFNALTGLAALPASLLAGVLWDWAGPSVPFYLGSGTAAAAALLLLLWGRKS